MPTLSTIAVNLGSNTGARPEYLAAAQSLGKTLAERRITLVYGGTDVGLMSALANAALGAGGAVIGVAPRFIFDKVGHHNLSRLELVDTMPQRKARMYELADGFIVLPGGSGTLEEMFEILTWAQLGLHEKPLGIINVAGYFDLLLKFLDHSVDQKFMRQEHRDMVQVASCAEELLEKMARFRAPRVEKWLNR